MADNDLRYDRDIYSWLASLELSQYYFLFKESGLTKIRDVLYLEDEEVYSLGIDDERHVARILLGIRHVCIPEAGAVNPKYSKVFQAGRLVVTIYSFVDYKTTVSHTRVCKGFQQCLRRGVRQLTIDRPMKIGADIYTILLRFNYVVELQCRKFFKEGAEQLGRAVTALAKERGVATPLKDVYLQNNEIGDEGAHFLEKAIASGACLKVERLHLGWNKFRLLGAASLSRAFGTKQLKNLEYLNVSGNQIADEGSKAIGYAIGEKCLPSLVELHMSDCLMGDVGMNKVSKGLQGSGPGGGPCKFLEVLDLRYNPASDPGALAVLRAIQCGGLPSICEVRLKGCRASREVAERFVKYGHAEDFDVSV